MNPHTPDNEVAIQTPLIDILRSVPKSCREMIQDGEHSHRNIPYGRLCHEAATELSEKTNEVARLKELLNKEKEEYGTYYARHKIAREEAEELSNEVARLRELLDDAQDFLYDLRGEWDWRKEEPRCGYQKEYERLGKVIEEIDRLAPSPEESVSKDISYAFKEGVKATLTGENNEVARLRELLEWGETLLCNAEPPKHSDHAEWMGLVHKWRDQKHGLAPAPEEPVSTPTDLNQQNKENTPSLNDWRELGADEVIQEGDEVQPKHYSFGSPWLKVQYHEYGATPEDQEAMRYRTRRPLPKQEEKITFDEELSVIFNADQHSVIEGRYATVGALRYLRNEIQRIDRALNIGEEDSGYNFVEIEKLKKEIQKLKSATK